MKRKLLCLMLGALLFALSAAARVRAEMEPLHISLWSDPEEGFEWTCEYEDNGVLEAPIQEFVADENGEGGSSEFYFGLLNAGRAQILLNYSNAYELGVPKRSAILTVIVDESGKSEVRWAEIYSDGQTLMFILPTNPTEGIDWNYVAGKSDMVTLTSESYSALSEDLAGAGGNTTYLFHVEKPGETVLLFNRANMWDPYATAEETYAVTVRANEQMEISISVDS